MTVKEFIQFLKKQDRSKRLVISGYEGGYDDVESMQDIDLVLNVNTAWYYGKHDTPDSSSDDRDIESCILISS
jgi:hypothetical protein